MAKTVKTAPASAATPRQPAAKRTLPAWAIPLGLVLLVLLLYANTLGHGYALDDSIVVSENKFTQKGFQGLADIFAKESFVGYFGEEKELVAGKRYRPLSIATLAVEVGLFGQDKPGISHFLNVVLFAIATLLVWGLARRTFSQAGPWLPAIAGALFAAHPIHTEAVANIKGRDEILALLFTLIALNAIWDWVGQRKPWQLVVAFGCFTFALFSKESPLPLVAVAPFMLLLHPQRKGIVDALLPTSTLLVAALIYLGVRTAVVGLSTAPATDLLNNSFRDATGLERIGTVFYCLAYYAKLLFAPWPLTHDYYPYHIALVNPWHPLALAGIALTLGLAVLGFVGVWKRKPYGWLLLFYLGTLLLVSNLVINVGVFMAERFLFIPSVAFCLLLGWGIATLMQRSRQVAAGIAIAACLAFGALTVMRNPVWKDNQTLFLTDVKTSTGSAKANVAGAAESLNLAKKTVNQRERQQLLDDALTYINRAVKIYPGHALAWDFKGHILMERGSQAEALLAYDEAVRLQPESPLFVRNLGVAASLAHDYPKSAAAFIQYLSLRPDDANAWFDLGLAYENGKQFPLAMDAYRRCVAMQPSHGKALGKMGMIQGQHLQRADSAIFYLEKAVAAGNPEEATFNNLGIAYAIQQDLPKSAEVLEKGLQQYPNSTDILRSLIVTHGQLGNTARAEELKARFQPPAR